MELIALPSNRPADRFYLGGPRIAEFRGETERPAREPEDWVGSTTTLAGESALGLTTLPDGRTLLAAVREHPVDWLGPEHVARFGDEAGLLVKLLDAGQRLPVHAHPDDAFAWEHLRQAHGKAEAWFLLRGGVVYLGLREELSIVRLRELVEAQDTEGMLALLHRVEVAAGDVVYVPPGVLHAIGEGVFLVEVQQPADLSILVEWEGFELDGRRDGHLGLGFDVVLDAVELRARSAAEIAELIRPAGTGDSVLPAESRRYFRLERHLVDDEIVLQPGFSVIVVTAGRFTGPGGRELAAGSTTLAPYAAGAVRLVGAGEVVVCRPPAP